VSFLKFLEKKIGLGIEKIKLPAGQAKKNDVTSPGPFWGGNMSKEVEKRMMNFNELADYIGLKPQTIRNKFYAGEFPIPAKKIFAKVLWDKKDVDKYLDKLPKIDC
jgi:predicted DNA-binding transcriptional regulator AlpA